MPKFKRKAKAKSLTPSQLNKVLKRCLIMSNPQLKRAVLVLSFSTLRVSELGQLTIDDLVFPNGEIKTEIALRAAICKRRKPRTIWLNEQTKKVLQEWFDYRNTKHWGTTFSSDYQGMNPKSIALLNQSGRSYSMKLKRRVNQSGENVDYLSCDSIEQLIRNIFARCGLNGASYTLVGAVTQRT